jgi:hypothetical protein
VHCVSIWACNRPFLPPCLLAPGRTRARAQVPPVMPTKAAKTHNLMVARRPAHQPGSQTFSADVEPARPKSGPILWTWRRGRTWSRRSPRVRRAGAAALRRGQAQDDRDVAGRRLATDLEASSASSLTVSSGSGRCRGAQGRGSAAGSEVRPTWPDVSPSGGVRRPGDRARSRSLGGRFPLGRPAKCLAEICFLLTSPRSSSPG